MNKTQWPAVLVAGVAAMPASYIGPSVLNMDTNGNIILSTNITYPPGAQPIYSPLFSPPSARLVELPPRNITLSFHDVPYIQIEQTRIYRLTDDQWSALTNLYKTNAVETTNLSFGR